MINLNSISLGDWFRYRYTTCDTHREIVRTFRVTAIEKMTGSYYVWGIDQNGKSLGRICPPEELEGIELTVEILEKNGFEKEKLTNVTIWRNGNFSMEFNAMSNRFYYGEVVMDFVHQFQHLIRLCGIDKEIAI